MYTLRPEVRELIAADTAAIYDIYARQCIDNPHRGLDIVRASAIVASVLEQTVEMPWAVRLHTELQTRRVPSIYLELSPREKKTLAVRSFEVASEYTSKARTIPQDVAALRSAVEAKTLTRGTLLTS